MTIYLALSLTILILFSICVFSALAAAWVAAGHDPTWKRWYVIMLAAFVAEWLVVIVESTLPPTG